MARKDNLFNNEYEAYELIIMEKTYYTSVTEKLSKSINFCKFFSFIG